MEMLINWILATGLLVTGVATLQQSDISRLASDMAITAEVTTNLEHSGETHQVKLTLTNKGNDVIPASGWRVYFHSFFMIFPDVLPKNKSIDLETKRVKFSVIGGDLYSFEPLPGFKHIETGQSRDLIMTVQWWSVSRTDFMPNWYVTSSNENETEPRILTSTRTVDYVKPFDTPKQWKRYDFDEYNPFSVQERRKRLQVKEYEWDGKNEDPTKIKMIIPTPTKIELDENKLHYAFGDFYKVYASTPEAEPLAELLSDLMGISRTTESRDSNLIKLSINPGPTPEAYTIRIVSTVFELIGNDVTGLFYAVQSMYSIFKSQGNNIPKMTITDAPRFPYRGLFLDVARNFHTVDDLKRVMTQMARYKLNSLHLHLADDEGWRLQIPGLPELTQVGGKRCHDLSEQTCILPQYGSGPTDTTSGSGFFTAEDYKEILRFAKDHFIEVIPEIDMPGHAHAAIVSMEQRYRVKMAAGNKTEAEKFRLKDPNDESEYLSNQQWNDNALNPCIESTYAFISKVVNEIKKLHSMMQPLKTYHFGGDEVAEGAWEKSPKCKQFLQENPRYNVSKGLKQYFAERVAAITGELDVGMRGWEDGLVDANNNPFPLERMNNSRLSANPWDNIWEWGASQRAYRLANAGYKVVMSQATHLYFDHPQEPDPEERGLYWATRFTDAYKVFCFLPDSLYDNIVEERSGKPLTKADVCGENMSKCAQLEKPENIIGMQGHLFSENIRTREHMDYMLFPRVLALAERAWHKADFEDPELEPVDRRRLMDAEWTSFANTLGHRELRRLEESGVQFRVPPPGASTMNNRVDGTVTYPGMKVQHSYLPKGETQLSWRDSRISTTWIPEYELFLRATTGFSFRNDDNRKSRAVKVTYVEEQLPSVGQPMVDYIASNVTARIEVLDNLNKVDNFMTVRLNLTNRGDMEITPGNWRIHLYSLYGFKPEILPCGLRVGHVNGGLFYLTPSSLKFSGLGPGQTLRCVLRNHWWTVTRTDQMPNWYVSATGTKAKVIANTADETLSFVGEFNTPAKWKRTKEDLYNPYTSSERYEMYKMDKSGHDPWRVVPTPESVRDLDESKQIQLTRGWTVDASSDFEFESKFLSDKLNIPLVRPGVSQTSIKFIKESQNNESEAYSLEIDPPNSVTIKAEDGRGALHGAQTLISLVEGSPNSSVPKMTIVDKPRFEYRGIMLDVARNFKDKAQVKKVLDAMSMYKLNKLHLHLSDDEGWRVEIPGLAELTEVGGRRCHTDELNACVVPALGSGPDSSTSGSGYYTISDYREILKYAADRHITIIPEIETPGHASAAITSMAYRDAKIAKLKATGASRIPHSFSLTDADMTTSVDSVQKWKVNAINPCMNSSYNFVEQVLNGFRTLHMGVMPLKIMHVGGDEVAEGAWDKSEHCKNRRDANGTIHTDMLKQEFMARVADIVASRNVSMAAWEDGMIAQDEPNPITNYKTPPYAFCWSSRWDEDHAKRVSQFADAGYKVIVALATYLYIDHPYEPDPEDRGLYWAARFIDTRKMFSFTPDHIWWNADVDRMGQPVDFKKICHNKPCPEPERPENIIGMQASLFSEAVRNEDHLHEKLFPKILALAERAWHTASWEDIEDQKSRERSQKVDWEDFATTLGYKEMARLEKNLIKYRVPPPGGILTDDKLRVNTLYPNHDVEYTLNDGQTWTKIRGETKLPSDTDAVLIRSRSRGMNRPSRVIEVKPFKPTTASPKSTTKSGPVGSSSTNRTSCVILIVGFIVYMLSMV